MADKVTVRDVAAEAKVSASTVSRALSSEDLVAPETRRRILEVAQALGYRPSPVAQGLVAGRSRTIGLLVPDIEHPCYSAIAKGVYGQALREGYSVVIADSDNDASYEIAAARRLQDQTDGLIICSSKMSEKDIEALNAGGPVVLSNRVCPGVADVGFDSTETVRQAVEHLHALGHRSIAYAGGPEGSWSDEKRRMGLASTAPKLAGLEVTDLGHFEPGFGGGGSAADLAMASGATAVLAFNDFMALEIMARLRRRGYRVPDDFSVVGIDDIQSANLTSPALTTVRTPLRQIGQASVNRLLDIVDPQAAPRPAVKLPVGLVVRESTSPPTDRAAVKDKAAMEHVA